MSKARRFVWRTFKGFYDILASYMLVWMLYISAVSLALYGAFSLLAVALGFETTELMWLTLSWRLKLDVEWITLAAYGPLHVAFFWWMRPILSKLMHYGERSVDAIQRVYARFGERFPRARSVTSTIFSVVVTLMLIPFVLQPTLVGMRFDGESMFSRTINLLDGQATRGFADSVVGFYRKLYAEPVTPTGGVPQGEIDELIVEGDPQGNQWDGVQGILPPKEGASSPLMDRWDVYIMKAAQGDAERFAYIKAFMWVESAGRQFAVSRTGCSGLMQFCGGTARRSPFVEVFGRGQVYRCGCKNNCRIPVEVRRDMERGDEALIDRRASEFPCDLTDARFDGAKSIQAGALYVDDLHRQFGGNIYLMYIGYNSGPAVARKLYALLGENAQATIEQIEVHLADVMRKWYGSSSEARARSLTRTHLPKIKKAFDRYYTPSVGQPIASN